MNWQRRSAKWLLVGLTGLAFVLRLFRLGYHELRGDESFGWLFSSQPLGSMLQQTLAYLEPHPPLDYVLLHFWAQMAGDSEWALRFTSLVGSVLAIPLIYQLARACCERAPQSQAGGRYGEAVALGAALLMAISPFQIWHAQEARMYALSTTLGLAASVALLHAERHGGRRAWAAFTLLSAANAYTHYYALFIIAAQGLYWLISWRHHRRQWKPWLLSQVGIIVLYLPWLAVGWRVMVAYHGNGDSPAFDDMLWRVITAFGVGQTIAPDIAAYILPAIVVVFIVGCVALARYSGPGAMFLTLYLVGPVLAVYLSSLSRPVFNERYLIAATPPFIIIVAAGVAGLPRLLGRRARPLAGLLGIVLVAANLYSLHGYFFDPQYTRNRGWRELAAHLQRTATPDDLIVQNYPDPTLWYYYQGSTPHIVLPAERPVDISRVAAALQQAGEAHDRIWFLPYKSADWDAEGAVVAWLDRHWERLSRPGDEEIGSFALRLYRPTRVALATARPTEAHWAGQIRLRAYRLVLAQGRGNAQTPRKAVLAPGDAITLTLFWEALQPPGGDYTVFIHLIAPDGRVVAQRDSRPLGGSYPTSEWQPNELILDRYVIIIPAEAKEGEYRLFVGLYNAGPGDRLPAYVGEAGSPADGYELTDKLIVENGTS